MPSSVIAGTSYDAASHKLLIRYVSGAIYEYAAVPSQVYEKMKKAVSKGKFLNSYIKGSYAFKKLKEED